MVVYPLSDLSALSLRDPNLAATISSGKSYFITSDRFRVDMKKLGGSSLELTVLSLSFRMETGWESRWVLVRESAVRHPGLL
jgi:hypothetical protein